MPIYEYECPECGKFEMIQKVSEVSDDKGVECPSENCTCIAKRVISASAFHLKGSGWYKTDYTSNSSAGGAAKASSASASEAAAPAADAKSDSGSGEKKTLKTTGGGGCGSGCGCH